MKNSSVSVDEYIESFPAEIRAVLSEIREIVRAAAPAAEETIGYGMPAYKSGGPLVYFAAFKNHLGFYPTASGVAAFAERLAGYKTSKGAVQFPLGEPLPAALIAEIVRFRVAENEAKALQKKAAKNR
ncbi:MAG: DUF1801 domain-containing protein [Acidobacteria bacterium]|nr:DUF1801 domain-containing protein [Acidobacteriota bacterium]